MLSTSNRQYLRLFFSAYTFLFLPRYTNILFTIHASDVRLLLLTLTSNLALLIPPDVIFQTSFVRRLLAVIDILLSYFYRNPTIFVSFLFTALNDGESTKYRPVLQTIINLFGRIEFLVVSWRQKLGRFISSYGFRNYFNKRLVKRRMWSS